MDPITVTTTIITLGTFIKDLIELGEGIRASIEKVSENRRQIRELTQDILRTLYDLASLTRGKEGAFRGPELLGALESLKAEMLYVHSKCLKIAPIQLPGFRGIPSHLKAWRKRDDLEEKIARLRERVNKCLLQFSAFSAARTEHVAIDIAHTTLRIEQRLVVDNVENQVKAHRLEWLMARFMLESEFGQHKLRETAENISADSSFQSLEYQYMSAQLSSLIKSGKPLLSCEDLSLCESWESDTLAIDLIDPSQGTLSHALSHILQIVVALHSRDHASLLDLLMTAIDRLPACFNFAEMDSEAIVWGHFGIDVLRYMTKRGCNIGTLPRIAHALDNISQAHRHQFEPDAAIEFSHQSLALWVEVSCLLPEADNRIGYLSSMMTHVHNLLAKDDKTTMLSAAQDAVSLARPMAQALAESIASRGTPLTMTAAEQYNTVTFCDAFFVLARLLSSLDRPLDSYEAFVEGYRTACNLPIFDHDLVHWGRNIDAFLDVICTVAEDVRLSLSLLADCVDLFCNLARIYPEPYSSRFLRLLHAFAYFSQQPHSCHSMEQLRVFLEPTSHAAPPAIDITRSILIDSSVLADAIRLFFAKGYAKEDCTIPIIQNILVAHFPQAIEALRVVVQSHVFNSNFFSAWVLRIACTVLPRLLPGECVALLQVLVETVKCQRSHAMLGPLKFEGREWDFAKDFMCVCHHAARLGVVDEGILFCQELETYVEAQSNAHPQWSQQLLELLVLLLCDAARFPDAVNLVKRKGSRFPKSIDRGPNCGGLTLWVMKAHILQHVGRHKEALQLLRTAVADGIRTFWTGGRTFDNQLYFLLPQLAWAWGQIGGFARALKHAEQAVAVCQDLNTEDGKEELILCAQIHSLITHSNCLAMIGRTAEGFESAQRAVLLHTKYSEYMWKDFIFTIRGQELGGSAFFSLSLRLLAVDDKEEALLNGRQATGLYRELVALAPRHLPTLARSIRHLASILWSLGHHDEATTASEEAVDILRKVVDPETYFLPLFADALDELAGYLTQRGDSSSASATTAEAAAARLKFASLPPEPEWLFMQGVDGDEDEDLNWWEWHAEQYHDAFEDLASADSAEADERDDAGDTEFDDTLDTTGIVEEEELQTITVETPEGNVSPIFIELGDGADQPSFRVQQLNDMDNSGTATAAGEAALKGETRGTFTNILSKPVEIRLSMRSTLMDFIWWILLVLLATLFAIMYARK
ncbi:Tetratricopeptide repeat family [Favolaschia claudopus]|uniref:Tetratricopeptide repeat family n=1 Tax=Favolaschia claudopus TaxID=2862362 RepID=A0AAV9Z6A8_9AGAR